MHFRRRASEELHALGEGGALRAVCAPDAFCALGINSLLTRFKTLQPVFAFFGGVIHQLHPWDSHPAHRLPKPCLSLVRIDATVRRVSLAYRAFIMKVWLCIWFVLCLSDAILSRFGPERPTCWKLVSNTQFQRTRLLQSACR